MTSTIDHLDSSFKLESGSFDPELNRLLEDVREYQELLNNLGDSVTPEDINGVIVELDSR